jgi:hypothetical protein
LEVLDCGPHKKLVCCDCLAFQEFLSKKEAATYEQIQQQKALMAELAEAKRREEERHCDECLHGYMGAMGLCSNPGRYFAHTQDERGNTGNCGPKGVLWESKTRKVQTHRDVKKQGSHVNYR